MDGRNNILDPSRGYFSSLTYNWGAKVIGSEFDFTRIFTQQFAYLPLPGGLVSASGFRFERSAGDSGQAFLSTERLAFGGPTTIRGYERDEVDLLDLLSASGATTKVLLLNQEARFPIFADLRGVAFFDYGRFEVNFEGTSGSLTRMGTGAGLRYSTPVGVLRFDVGYPLRGEDRKVRYYFGLGQAF
jgi:translocation and assembly module TamA